MDGQKDEQRKLMMMIHNRKKITTIVMIDWIRLAEIEKERLTTWGGREALCFIKPILNKFI